jgi:hypothetical protein
MAEQPLSTPTAAAIQQKQKLEPLHVRIGRLRDQARAEVKKTGPPAREQVGIEDAAIRVAAGPAASKRDAERRGIMRDLRPGTTVEGTTEGTKSVATKPTSSRFTAMDDDELQAVDYNNLSSSDSDAYVAELEARTPERPASPNGDGGDFDDLDLDDNDEIPGHQPLPWEAHHPDNNGGQ